MKSDWKQIPNSTEWYQKNDKYSFVRVWKPGLNSKERKKRGILVWGVAHRIGRTGLEHKQWFKRKPSALLYAHAYMRSH